ncbi:MAG: hypothetical protein NBV67_18320 [Tagaea sp.]|nr:hypothetical protein [Tagaea sp.]
MRYADMITVVVHERESDAPLRVEPELIAHLLRKTPSISANSMPGKRTLIFAMSREEWEREFPAETQPAL